MTGFFPGFAAQRIKTSGADLNLVTGGSGPPLLLRHGYPQTHLMAQARAALGRRVHRRRPRSARLWRQLQAPRRSR